MLKLLTIGILFYLLYRVVISPNRLKQGAQNSADNTSDDGEYVDYEEIE